MELKILYFCTIHPFVWFFFRWLVRFETHCFRLNNMMMDIVVYHFQPKNTSGEGEREQEPYIFERRIIEAYAFTSCVNMY